MSHLSKVKPNRMGPYPSGPSPTQPLPSVPPPPTPRPFGVLNWGLSSGPHSAGAPPVGPLSTPRLFLLEFPAPGSRVRCPSGSPTSGSFLRPLNSRHPRGPPETPASLPNSRRPDPSRLPRPRLQPAAGPTHHPAAGKGRRTSWAPPHHHHHLSSHLQRDAQALPLLFSHAACRDPPVVIGRAPS